MRVEVTMPTLGYDMEAGKIAAWLAPPRNGINGKPFDYEYVHLA